MDRLVAVLATADLVAARELLGGMTGDDLSEAKRWFEKSRRWTRNLGHHVTFDREARDADEDPLSVRSNAAWIVAMCAVTLCGPRTAATRIDWTNHWDFRNDRGEAAFVHLLWEKDADWVAEFADAASRVRLGGRARNCNANLSRVLRAAVVHHGLPAPTGNTFLKAWRAGTPASKRWPRDAPRTPLVKWLAIDPLMPDLLWHYLASGHCGDDEADLPVAVARLEASGVIERGTLVETVLVALTAGQPAVAQRTLAKVLDGIGLRASEVRGGLPYLLGVLATADRSVGPSLLPLALELVTDGDGLRALTDVVAARPEKKPRDLLLSALRKQEIREWAGDQAITEVFDVLATTDDASYVAKVDALRTRLGPETQEAAHEKEALGLWGLAPSPSGTEYTDQWWSIDDYWRGAVDSFWPDGRRQQAAEVVDRELLGMQQGTYDATRLVKAVQIQLDKGACHAGGLAAALEELFLRGGLQQSWDAALACADLCAGATKRPTGLAELLRVLGRYAGEVPGPRTVPPRLGALAVERSSSKASTEARRLVGLLTGEDEQTAVARLRTAAPPPAAVEHRGRWDLMSDETAPLPAQVPVSRPADPIEGLQRLAPLHWDRVDTILGDVGWTSADRAATPRVGLVDTDVLLGTVLAGVHRYAANAVRSALNDVELTRRPSDEIVSAVGCWLDGALDLTSFWRLATARVASALQIVESWRAGAWVHDQRAWREGLAPFSERLRLPDDAEAGVLVVPAEIGTPGQRFLFLRAAEALLRAEESPVLLGLPTWRDGTLELDDLLARLRTVADSGGGTGGVVGPLDLVLALHRLREVDPARVDEVPRGLVTDARFTDPAATESWDASALVRHWIASGGLPALTPVARDGAWTGAPTTPVPYSSLAAWPAELADDPWSPIVVAHDPWSKFRMETVLRLYPRWPDRAFAEAYLAGWWGGTPTLAAGPLGLAVHDVLLSQLTPAGDPNGRPQPAAFIQQVRWGRIDPATAAAAAVGRHEAGTLGLTGLTRTLAKEMETHLRGLWPITLAIADALCGRPRRPAALADLLRTLTSYAHEVPASAVPELPAGIAALAGSKGATKAHLAARDLVTGLRNRIVG